MGQVLAGLIELFRFQDKPPIHLSFIQQPISKHLLCDEKGVSLDIIIAVLKHSAQGIYEACILVKIDR